MSANRAVPTVLIAFALLLSFTPSPVQLANASQQTHLALSAPSTIHSGDEWSATATLTDSMGLPVAGAWVTWYLDGQEQGTGVTSSNGSSFFGVGNWQPPLGANTIGVSFNGTSSYLPSNATATIDVLAMVSTTYTSTTTATANAGPVVELSSSNGSDVCPSYFKGNGSEGIWSQAALTCTMTRVNSTSFPNFCVSMSPGGCTLAPVGRLVIDDNVTVVAANGLGLVIYSELDNYGTLESGLVNYGTVVNHGTIDLNGTNQLLNLPYNGLGIINNTAGAGIYNWYYITNAGGIYNEGTIVNHGQFISQECAPCITGVLVNDGNYIGSAPAPVVTSSVNLYGGNGTADQNSTAGVTVSITGATGTNITVSTQVQGAQAPPGIGSVRLNSTSYYDILIAGTTTGTARVCIASKGTNSSSIEIAYWNGSTWAAATDQTVSGSSPLFTSCGDMPVSALAGTPLALGTVITSGGNTGSATETSTASETSQSGPSTTSTQSRSTNAPPLSSASWAGVLTLGAVIVLTVGIAAFALLKRKAGAN